MLDKLAEINNPKQTYHFPTQDEINESNLKLEREKFKMEKEKMRLQFMCDYILKYASEYSDRGYSAPMHPAAFLRRSHIRPE